MIISFLPPTSILLREKYIGTIKIFKTKAKMVAIIRIMLLIRILFVNIAIIKINTRIASIYNIVLMICEFVIDSIRRVINLNLQPKYIIMHNK